MKKILQSLTLIVLGLTTLNISHAQIRYKDQIFDSHQKEVDITIGVNVDALRSNFTDQAAFSGDMTTLNTLMQNGEDFPMNYFLSNADLPADQHTAAKLIPIKMDIYTPPADDEESNRPVILYLHTGNFLPGIINGGPTGSKQDSVLVNMCKRWAQAGYVVAAVDYRLGWNPISSDPDVRRGTLLKAVYRAIHDTQTAVRYLRATVGEGNPYKIDPDKIALFGQGSGGYVAQAYATLDDYNTQVLIDKFEGADGLPYVIEGVDGTIDGGPGFTRLPDPLQVAGISKKVSMSINLGGALADISWLKQGHAPMIALHCVRDPFAPFDNGTVVVPTTNEDVVDVSGGNVFIQKAVDLGNNDVFLTIPDGNDPFTDRARETYGQTFDYILSSQPTITISQNPEGLFPFVLPINTMGGNRFTNQGAPWEWWDYNTLQAVVAGVNAALNENYNADVIHQQSVASNPGMGPEKGKAYIDTIQGYVNPRIMCVFELPGAPCTVGINDAKKDNNTTTSIYPNPAQSSLTIRNDESLIRRVELVDITGRVVSIKTINAHTYTLHRGNLNNGIYLLKIHFDKEQITKKVLFN